MSHFLKRQFVDRHQNNNCQGATCFEADEKCVASIPATTLSCVVGGNDCPFEKAISFNLIDNIKPTFDCNLFDTNPPIYYVNYREISRIVQKTQLSIVATNLITLRSLRLLWPLSLTSAILVLPKADPPPPDSLLLIMNVVIRKPHTRTHQVTAVIVRILCRPSTLLWLLCLHSQLCALTPQVPIPWSVEEPFRLLTLCNWCVGTLPSLRSTKLVALLLLFSVEKTKNALLFHIVATT